MNIIEGDGWEKLCKFLEKPIQNRPFKNRNIVIKLSEKDNIEIIKPKNKSYFTSNGILTYNVINTKELKMSLMNWRWNQIYLLNW